VTLLVAFALLVCSVLAQQREDKVILDDFESDTGPLIIQIDASAIPETRTASTTGTTIVGGERDLILTDTSGPDNSILTAGVSGGQWSVAAPHSSAGFSIMQYDGVDGSPTLVRTGLNGIDFTANGADAFHLTLQADQDTKYTITVYSSGGSSSSVVNIPGDDTTHEYFVEFKDFSGQASFSAVGAVEVRVEMFVDVDAFLELFATAGPPATPTPTPTPSRNPPPPPASPPASPPPSPEPSKVRPSCHCNCPVFHCGVVFATPGDDDDSVDDDTHDDDEFVYRPVYYGPEDDDFKDILGDDDDNEFLSFEGHLSLNGVDDDYDLNRYTSGNGSSSLVVSVFLLSIVALLI